MPSFSPHETRGLIYCLQKVHSFSGPNPRFAVRIEGEEYMKEITSASARRLYRFLSACGGNWRNTIHIAAQGSHTGWLMAADQDGKPVVMAVDAFQKLTQEQIDPAECRGYLTESAFGDIFARYLLWQIPDAGGSPADALSLLSSSF